MVTVTDAVLTNRQFFINRWQAEYPAFVRVMQALPPDQLGYRPHARSRSAAELVWLLAEEALAASALIDAGEIYWVETAPSGGLDQMIGDYQRHHSALVHRVAVLDDALWLRTARFFDNGHVAMEGSTGEIMWLLFFDAIHHRGQLSTYIRPMGGKVPSIYGPSGDEPL
jgi:uncharacterized damage-inducible protein DinB